MSKQNLVYYLTFEDIQNRNILYNSIYMNKKTNYYISEDFSENFYIYLAYYGFICTSTSLQNKFYLLAEMQFEYAILDFKDLHISKKIALLIKKDEFTFSINTKFEEVINKLEEYHKTNWDAETPDDAFFIELMRVSKNQIVWGGNYFHNLHLTGVIVWNKKGSGNFKEGELAKTSLNTFKVFDREKSKN